MQCRLCRGDTIEFLNLGLQPLANKYPKKEEVSQEEFFPLPVHFCVQCLAVQLGTVVSRARMFEDYYYLSSVNAGLVRHFESLADSLRDAHLVVDVGSNDGILLRPLKERGVFAVGVDPSVNVSKIANDAGLTTLVSFFDSATVETIHKDFGIPDVVVASSIFTHVEDPHAFCADVTSLLPEGGRFIVEVEYVGNIVESLQFERFYHDRIFYYSASSLVSLLKRHDLTVIDIEDIATHGGSIRVTAVKGGAEESDRLKNFIEKEAIALTQKKMLGFASAVDHEIKKLNNLLTSYRDQNLVVAGYGAPARVATITNYGHIGPDLVKYIVDDSPLKQHRLSPGMHIPIVPSTELEVARPDVVVVFAYEYFEDIRKKIGNDYRFIVPIPAREIT